MKEEPLAFAVPQRSKPEIDLGDTMEIHRVHVFVGLPSGHRSSELRGMAELSLKLVAAYFIFLCARSLALIQGSSRGYRENDLLDRTSYQGVLTSKASAITPLTPRL